uniref:Uncharacterized protein n=1 Tax=Micrurus corallinus TaxID=54390 RepID=A0A2D4EKL0_MICCO
MRYLGHCKLHRTIIPLENLHCGRFQTMSSSSKCEMVYILSIYNKCCSAFCSLKVLCGKLTKTFLLTEGISRVCLNKKKILLLDPESSLLGGSNSEFKITSCPFRNENCMECLP